MMNSVCRPVFVCAGAALILAACASTMQQQENLPVYATSKWGGQYTFRYDPPTTAPPRSVPVVIAVVNPNYRVEESALGTTEYRTVGKGFSASMGVDMDKVLIAKGMTTMGPFPNLEEITYSQKKNASLTLAPKVFVTARIQYPQDWRLVKGRTAEGGIVENRFERPFTMSVSGWVAYVMREPLSGEKMWVKRLELPQTTKHGFELMGAEENYTTTQGFFGPEKHFAGHVRTGEMKYDGKPDALADVLEELYPTIMEKCWVYMDTEELTLLKAQTQEIRELKRY